MTGAETPGDTPAAEIWLAAGGTGGHIYPALEVGRELRKARPGIAVTWLCGNRPGELSIYRHHGIDPIVLPLSGRRPGLANQARFAVQLVAALRRCRALARERRPRIAVGFGGYASAPALWAARSVGARTMIQEQNARPGLANRLLARKTSRIYAGMPIAPGHFPAGKTLHTGNPVRAALVHPPGAVAARRHFGLGDDLPVVLCFGGSLGARGLNRLVLQALNSPISRRWQWLWSTGPDHFDRVRTELARVPAPARVLAVPYLAEMDLAYAAADLVLCRAGALTLAELAVLGKPSILVPLPRSAGDHQWTNARRFEERGAAILVEESDSAAAQKIVTCLEQFESDCDKLRALGEAARQGAHPDAAREIAKDLLRFLA